MTTPYRNSRDAESDGPASTSAIRADIERTRERLGATVEALGAQLNPSNLKQRVKDSVREATIGKVQHMASNTTEKITETGRGLAQVIRDNPLPAAVAAAGLGWLILSSRDQRETRRFAGVDPYEFGNRSEPGQSRVRETVRNVADTVADKAHDLTERAGDATQRVVEKARETGELVAEKADAAVQRVQQTTRNSTRRIGNQFEDTPIGMGAVALALGLAIGMSVPSTRREAALMGDARDKLLDKTRERVADTADRVERVVERALPEVKNVVRDAAREVREAARDEGLPA
jgi:hypothetical protein